jgi:transposase-like protein
MRQKKDKKAIVEEYVRGGVSLRELSKEHGIKYQTLHRWVKEHESGVGSADKRGREVIDEMPRDVRKLQRELYEARLKAKLFETMVEVAEKELGIRIRKNFGAK